MDMHITVQIIYPENRRVTIAKLLGWACDAVANGETVTKTTPKTFAEVVSVLEDSGAVTFTSEIDGLLNDSSAYDLLTA